MACTYSETSRRVRVTSIAMEKQYVLTVMSVCLYSCLVYSACKAHASHCIVISGLSCCTAVYTLRHQRYDFRGESSRTQNVCWTVPLLLLWGFVAYSGVNFTFTFTFYKNCRSNYKAMKRLPSTTSKISSQSLFIEFS